MTSEPKALLRSFLEANWLKPFDAVWDASVASTLTSVRMEEPSLDLGCGDGLFMLIALGGRVRMAYDRYTDTHLRLRGDLSSAPASMTSVVSALPQRRITVGLDWKAGLVDKARRMQTYRHLLVGDGQALPFKDRAFASVFCNILYWLPDWQAGLREMRRVLRADGRLVLVVPNRHVGDCLRSYHKARRYRQGRWRLAANFFAWIDHGRFSTLTRLTGDREEWRHRLRQAGFELGAHYPVLDSGAVVRWDFSTRPLLHGLVLMGRGLRAVGLKPAVKHVVVRMWQRRVWPWLERSLTPTEDACGLWVLVAAPSRQSKPRETVQGRC